MLLTLPLTHHINVTGQLDTIHVSGNWDNGSVFSVFMFSWKLRVFFRGSSFVDGIGQIPRSFLNGP